jgi:hypothetical protein
MKYEQTDTVFRFKRRDEILKVVPFNGETEEFLCKGQMINDVSWSHGFTHFKLEDGTYAGFCGVNYFEENAKPIGPHIQRDWLKI